MVDVLNSDLLVELKRRSIPLYRLPARPSAADLGKFSQHMGLSPATGTARLLQDEVVKKEGLGVWLDYLERGADRARKAGRACTWDDVLKSDALFQKLGGRP